MYSFIHSMLIRRRIRRFTLHAPVPKFSSSAKEMRLNHGLSLLFLAAFASANLTSEYDHTAYLDSEEKYKLYWSVNDADKSIDFAVEVHTTGWVGFGISAGLSGSMKGADIVIGWVDSQGKGHLQVCMDFRGLPTSS